MKGLFGITNLTITRVYEFFEKKHVPVQLILTPHLSNPLPKNGVALVSSVALLSPLGTELTVWGGVVYVFDVPIRCEQVDGLRVLDAKKRNPFLYTYQTLPMSAILKTYRKSIKEKKKGHLHVGTLDIIPKMLGDLPPSVLNPLLTYLYSLPSTKKRDMTAVALYSWLISREGVDALSGRLGVKKISPRFKVLAQALQEEHMAKFRNGLAEVYDIWKANQRRPKGETRIPVIYPKIAKKHSVEAHELKFVFKSFLKAVKNSGGWKNRTLADLVNRGD